MKKLTGISLFIFFCVTTAILTAGLVFQQNSNLNGGSVSNSTASSTLKKLVSGGVATLSLSEVSKHNAASDCWMIISGKVYDLSGYDANHPGGTYTIDSFCGKEATEAFNTKGRTGGRPHSSYADSLLAQYYLGDLNQKIVK